MEHKKRKFADRITERDFNQLLRGRSSGLPWEDSKGGSSEDQLFEYQLGESMVDDLESDDEDPIVADFHSGAGEDEEFFVNMPQFRENFRPDFVRWY
jgi:hypothetical protein